MTYTDFIDQPIAEGDEIIYAQSAYGGGAVLKRADILKIIPLVPHRDGAGYMREDQATAAHATVFRGGQYEDPAKRYVIHIWKERWRPSRGGPQPQRYTIPHSNHIFKVPK